MKNIQISRTEFFVYIKIILALTIVPFLLYLFYILFNQFCYEHARFPFLLRQFKESFSLLELMGTSIATAIVIHRSEKRKGRNDRWWLTIGILFGFIGFLSYMTWNLCKEFNALLPKTHQLLKKRALLLNLFGGNAHEAYKK